jgi:hypothetical protein
MKSKDTILSIKLPREIVSPEDDSEKFRNSDISWRQVDLAKNPKASAVAFEAAKIGGAKVLAQLKD